jgi:hypothetical protein
MPHPVLLPRSLAGLSTAAMVAIAVAALTDLLYAFEPLVPMWAVREAAHRGGDTPGVVMGATTVSLVGVVVVVHLAAALCMALWLYRAAANAHALGHLGWPPVLVVLAWCLPVANWVLPAVLTVMVAAAARVRRWPVWAWWGTLVAGLVALVAGAFLSASAELDAMLARVADGATVDVARATELLGYEIAGRLPGAVLLVAAGVLGIVAVHLVTSAQYDRFDEVRVRPAVPRQRTGDGMTIVPAGGTIGA